MPADMSLPLPLVSIVVATYNAGAVLEGCLASVRSQAPDIAELVVIDGGSTDATVKIIRANAASVAYWHSAPDRGIADAWNQGLRHVRGQWVLFLGADDRFAGADTLSGMLPTLEAHPDRLVVFGKVRMVGGPWDAYVLGETWRWCKFRLRMTIPHQGAFHNARLFREFGPFDPSIRMAADYEMLLRPGAALEPVFVDRVVAAMGGDGTSISSPHLTIRESRDAQLRHSVAPRTLIHAFYLYRSLRSSWRHPAGSS